MAAPQDTNSMNDEQPGRARVRQPFCVSPWVEAVLHETGDVQACCFTGTVLGNWKRDGIGNVWRSPAYRRFREAILAGEFPEDACRRCLANGTNTSFQDDLAHAFNLYRNVFLRHVPRFAEDVGSFERILMQPPETPVTEQHVRIASAYLDALRSAQREAQPTHELTVAIAKLEAIGKIALAYWTRDVLPPITVPFRRIQIITECNARCIQCPWKYTGIIERESELEAIHLRAAFDEDEGMIGFIHHGTELLFYKHWRNVVDRLAAAGIKTTLFTNSILLTPANVRYLVDQDVILNLNVSVDGATKATVEAIRVHVNFDRLESHVRYLFEYTHARGVAFPVTFSFVLLTRNHLELPAFVRRVEEWRGEHRHLPCTIAIQLPELNDVEGYREFLTEEHPSRVPRVVLQRLLVETLEASERAGIPVYIAGGTLASFLDRGCPIPVDGDLASTARSGEATSDASQIEATRIDFTRGWHAIEDAASSARWIGARALVTLHHAAPSRTRRLTLTAMAFARPRTLQVLLNGHLVHEVLVPTVPTPLDIQLAIREGANELVLLAPEGDEIPARIPALASSDCRNLAFHLRKIQLSSN